MPKTTHCKFLQTCVRQEIFWWPSHYCDFRRTCAGENLFKRSGSLSLGFQQHDNKENLCCPAHARRKLQHCKTLWTCTNLKNSFWSSCSARWASVMLSHRRHFSRLVHAQDVLQYESTQKIFRLTHVRRKSAILRLALFCKRFPMLLQFILIESFVIENFEDLHERRIVWKNEIDDYYNKCV